MSNRSVIKWLVALVFLAVLLGVVGGGLMGGVVGYYVASNHQPIVLPSTPAELAVAKSLGQPPVITKLSLSSDSAVIDTVKKAEPAVVTVINTLGSTQSNSTRSPFGFGGGIAEGSGVIFDTQGHIITNNHVVENARQLDIVLQDGTKLSAKLIGTDPVADLAVLKVDGNIPAYVPLGDSNALQLGETVIAIGSPLGSYRGSVTVGVVSGVNRSVEGTGQEGLIQTDAAINNGNSGGPLLNLAGQVIGINTLVVRDTNMGNTAEGLGFAIPSSTVSAISKQLIANGKVVYPFIGINYTELTPQSAAALNLTVQSGVLVHQVTPGSPAADAGIQTDDIITAIDGTKLDQDHSLRSVLFQHQTGDSVTLTVQRGSGTLSLKITLTARPADTTPG